MNTVFVISMFNKRLFESDFVFRVLGCQSNMVVAVVRTRCKAHSICNCKLRQQWIIRSDNILGRCRGAIGSRTICQRRIRADGSSRSGFNLVALNRNIDDLTFVVCLVDVQCKNECVEADDLYWQQWWSIGKKNTVESSFFFKVHMFFLNAISNWMCLRRTSIQAWRALNCRWCVNSNRLLDSMSHSSIRQSINL